MPARHVATHVTCSYTCLTTAYALGRTEVQGVRCAWKDRPINNMRHVTDIAHVRESCRKYGWVMHGDGWVMDGD